MLLDVDPKEVCSWKVLVLAKHPAKRDDLVQRCTGQDKAAATMRKDSRLLGPHRRSKVIGRLGVEVRQEAIEVVVVDVRVQLDKHVPLRLGPHVRGPLHHGQKLVLVEPPALGRLLLGGVCRLHPVVDVKVRVVELVLGPQMGEGVGNLEAIVRVFAVGEDEQVLLAAAQAVEVEGQLGRDFSCANLQHDGDALHDARGERRALLAEADLRHGAGVSRRGPLGEHVIAALAAQQAGDEGGQEEGADYYGSA